MRGPDRLGPNPQDVCSRDLALADVYEYGSTAGLAVMACVTLLEAAHKKLHVALRIRV